MAPLLPRSALPPPPLRDGSLDQRQPLLSPALLSRATPQHRGKDHKGDSCKEWKRRICRTCCFWRCKPDSRDYEQSPPSEPELRRRDPPQPRNEAVLGRQTSTLRKRPNVPLKTGRTTGPGPQQPLATGSPTRKVRFILLRRCPLLLLLSSKLIDPRKPFKTALATAQPATIHRRRCGELDGCASGSRPPRYALPPRNPRAYPSPTSPPL